MSRQNWPRQRCSIATTELGKHDKHAHMTGMCTTEAQAIQRYSIAINLYKKEKENVPRKLERIKNHNQSS